MIKFNGIQIPSYPNVAPLSEILFLFFHEIKKITLPSIFIESDETGGRISFIVFFVISNNIT